MQLEYKQPIKLLCLYFLCVLGASFVIKSIQKAPATPSIEDEGISQELLAEIRKLESIVSLSAIPRDIKIENKDLTGIKKIILDKRKREERRQQRLEARKNALLAAAAAPVAAPPVHYHAIFDSLQASGVRSTIIKEAKKHLGLSYVWGGTTPKGFDCSGFTSYVMAQKGVNIARTSRYQAKQGNSIDLNKVKTGDLIFFSKFGKGGTITHVAMVVDNKEDGVYIIHSTRRGIVVDNLSKSNYWRPKIQYAKDVISKT